MTTSLVKDQLSAAAFGLGMTAAAGFQTAGTAFVLAVLSALAVMVGIRIRLAGTVAVLLAAAAVVLSDASSLIAGLAGLCGAGYLVLRHTGRGVRGQVAALLPVLVAALIFTVVAVSAAVLLSDVRWLALPAPLALFAAYVLATQPYLVIADEDPAV